MKAILAVWAVLLGALVVAATSLPAPAQVMTGVSNFVVGTSGGGGGGGLSLDGSNANNVVGGTSQTITLTTTKTNDIIVVCAVAGSSTVSGVSDTSGLTWTHRGTNTTSGQRLETWWALATGTLSGDTITITYGASNTYEVIVFAVNGAHTAGPWDTNAGLPATSGFAGAPSISTSNANDFIFGYITGASGLSPGAGWTTLKLFSFSFTEYQIVSSTQSGLSANYSGGSGTVQSGIGDAIIAGP